MLDRAAIDRMRDTLRSGGVQTVTAPQLFPTPPELAARLVKLAGIRPNHRVLEPSAGTGNIARAIRDECGSAALHVLEINRQLAERLAKLFGYPAESYTATCADFLECNGDIGAFDRIVTNPPFASGRTSGTSSTLARC